jgi:hypothetical protein
VASELEDILAAVKGAVEGLSLTLAGASIPVLLGKSPRFRTGLEPPVALTVSKSETAEKVARWTTSHNRTDYFVAVTLVSPWRGPDSDLSDHGEVRQAILDAFASKQRANLALDGLRDVKARPTNFLPPQGQEQEWDYQGVEVEVQIVRAR